MPTLRWRTLSFLHSRAQKKQMQGSFIFKISVVIGATLVLLMVFYFWLLTTGGN